MKKVKICGITNLEDALVAVRAGADALGFVFYPESPRYITPQKAKDIVKRLPPFIEKVGLFVNVDKDEIEFTCKESGMSLAQIHFDVSDTFLTDLKIPYIRVVRAKCKEDIVKFGDEYRIVDAFVQSYGGEGKRIDKNWFTGIDCSRIIVAGGLNSSNLKELEEFDFYGFDVSSGVEKSKGIKDKKLVYEFIKEAKNC